MTRRWRKPNAVTWVDRSGCYRITKSIFRGRPRYELECDGHNDCAWAFVGSFPYHRLREVKAYADEHARFLENGEAAHYGEATRLLWEGILQGRSSAKWRAEIEARS